MSAANHADAASVADIPLTMSPAMTKCRERIAFELTVSRRRWCILALVCLVAGGALVWKGWFETSVLAFLLAAIAVVQIADITGMLGDVRRRQKYYSEA